MTTLMCCAPRPKAFTMYCCNIPLSSRSRVMLSSGEALSKVVKDPPAFMLHHSRGMRPLLSVLLVVHARAANHRLAGFQALREQAWLRSKLPASVAAL